MHNKTIITRAAAGTIGPCFNCYSSVLAARHGERVAVLTASRVDRRARRDRQAGLCRVVRHAPQRKNVSVDAIVETTGFSIPTVSIDRKKTKKNSNCKWSYINYATNSYKGIHKQEWAMKRR